MPIKRYVRVWFTNLLPAKIMLVYLSNDEICTHKKADTLGIVVFGNAAKRAQKNWQGIHKLLSEMSVPPLIADYDTSAPVKTYALLLVTRMNSARKKLLQWNPRWNLLRDKKLALGYLWKCSTKTYPVIISFSRYFELKINLLEA